MHFSQVVFFLPLLASARKPLKSRYGGFATYNPGELNVGASDSPFLTVQNPNAAGAYTNFYLRPSDSFAYASDSTGGSGALCKQTNNGVSETIAPGDCNAPNSCSLVFGDDGNLVEFYNGQAVFQSNTAGQGVQLALNPTEPYAVIYDGNNNAIYYTNLPGANPNPPGGGNCPGMNGC